MVIELKRVCYGKDNTSMEDREYSQGYGYPVATVKELKEFYKNFPNIKKIICYNKDRTEIEQIIEL